MKRVILLVLVLTTAVFITCKKKEVKTTGDLQGIVKNSDGQPLDGATVSLGSANTKTTGTDGKYFFTGLEPKDYIVTVSKSGFQTNSQSITIIVGETKTIDFNLSPIIPSISITSPSNSSNWLIGSQQNITWSSTNLSGNIKIDLYKNNLFIQSINNSLSNMNSYSWTIPCTLQIGVDYRIKITSLDNSNVNSESLLFTITNTNGTIVIDNECNIYQITTVGTQVWMKQNLKTGIFKISNNTGINHSDVSNNGVVEKYCYDNLLSNCANYGGLYDWDELMNYSTQNMRGICPEGWHIPTDNEWSILLGQGSINIDPISINSGFRDSLGGFQNSGSNWNYALYPSSTESNVSNVYSQLFFTNGTMSVSQRNNTGKKYGFSVRCIKD